MSISDDIAAVLSEVATSLTIHKPDGTTVTGEFMDYETHTDHTTPLIRAFMFDYTLAADTQVVVGDVIEFAGRKVLVLVKEPEYFENTIVDFLSSGYKCNVVGSIEEYDADAGWDSEYKKNKPWTEVHASFNAVMMDRKFRSNMLPIADASMEIELDRLHLFLSDYYMVNQGDRFRLSATEAYKVEQVESYNIPGIQLVFLTEDSRE